VGRGEPAATAKPQPELRVGLISYGNDSYDAQGGWVRKDSDLTSDLDGIYSKLFALRTNGGSEYVARAVADSTTQMQWSQDPKALKIIFVAGNEPANQDPKIPVESAVQQAREKGIFVNTIYCGSESNGEAVGWRGVASLGNGKFAAIDQNQQVAIATPVDAQLNQLSTQLNNTYVAYGASGGEHARNQVAQDANASSASGAAAASRAVAKSSGLYSNEGWDLVDAGKKGRADVKKMKDADLPAAMRGMKPADREAFIAKKAEERAAIQKQIADVSQKRDQYLHAERAKRAKTGKKAIDDAFNATIRTEAESAGYAMPAE
jgi:hypothetical protein